METKIRNKKETHENFIFLVDKEDKRIFKSICVLEKKTMADAMNEFIKKVNRDGKI